MPTKRNRRVGVQSRKVKKPKNFSRKLSVSGKAKKRRSSAHGSSTHRSGAHGSSTHRSGTRRRVQRGGVLGLSTGAGIGIVFAAAVGWLGLCGMIGGRSRSKLCPIEHTGGGSGDVTTADT